MKIAVYSGSFNPFHEGHYRIIEKLNSLQDIEKVIVVVSPKNPSKPESYYIYTPEERFKMVKDACKDLEKVEVSDMEFHRTPPCYTIDTLNQIQEQYPNSEIWYSCGADTLEKVGRWRNGKAYFTQYGILVSPRSGYNLSNIIKDIKERRGSDIKVSILDIPENRDIPISSTEIRERNKKSD